MHDSIKSLERQLANLKAAIAELDADPANDAERRELEAQAGSVILRLYKLRAAGRAEGLEGQFQYRHRLAGPAR